MSFYFRASFNFWLNYCILFLDVGDMEATNGKQGIFISGLSEEMVDDFPKAQNNDVYQADTDGIFYEDGIKMNLIDGE